MAEVRILNSNLSLKIRIKEGSFRVLSHMVQNLNSKMAQTHLNSNLLIKIKQSTPKKRSLKLKLAKLELQMRKLKPKIRKVEGPKQKTKQSHQLLKNFQTTSNSSTTSQPTKSSHIDICSLMGFMWSKLIKKCGRNLNIIIVEIYAIVKLFHSE